MGNQIFFDLEFFDNAAARRIDPISIGLVKRDGSEYYAEFADFAWDSATPWLHTYVVPQLKGGAYVKSRQQIAREIIQFVGTRPAFFGWYCAYDFVCLMQLYGALINRPQDWPFLPYDLRLIAGLLRHGPVTIAQDRRTQHNALADAKWIKQVWELLAHTNPIMHYLD